MVDGRRGTPSVPLVAAACQVPPPQSDRPTFLESPEMSERWGVVRSFSNEFDAELARAELEAAGIPVQLLSDGLSGLHPHLQFARGIRLAVPESELQAAQDLLDAPPAPE